MVDRAPQIVRLTIDLYEYIIEAPALPSDLAKLLGSTLLDLSRHHWAEAVPPKSHRLVSDVDAAFVKQVFNVPKRERKADIHHHRKTNDLRRRFEIAEWVARPSRSDPSSITGRLI